jgi:hypothetical protein
VEQEKSSEQPTSPTSERSALPCWFAVPCLSLMLGLTACGPTPSDNASNLGARPHANGAAVRGAGQGGPSSMSLPTTESQTSSTPGIETNVGGNKPAAALSGEPDNRDKVPVPGLPAAIAKDLDSPDARVRYRALDHWESKDNKAPLDPVFEAMEDDDPAVRAKATAIVEQNWAAEQEREKG